MPDSKTEETTQLLRAWAGGNSQALTRLVPRVHRELRRLAVRFLRNERAGVSLQATDLVQEVYLRLVDADQLDWQHRAHFFAVTATMMRRILVDRARRRCAARRGNRPAAVHLEDGANPLARRSEELVELDDALEALAAVDPRKARVVELRFFAGLGVNDTAAVLGISPETVMRDWKFARAWLSEELKR